MKTMVDDGMLYKLFKSNVVMYIASMVIIIIGTVVGCVCALGGEEIGIFSLSYNIFLGLELYDKIMIISAIIAISSVTICVLLIFIDIFLSRYNDIKNSW